MAGRFIDVHRNYFKMVEYTFSSIAYFDTNIISNLAKVRPLWPNLFEFLRTNNLAIEVSTPQFTELADARSIHPDLVILFMNVSIGILKIWDEKITEEVRSLHNFRSDSLLLYPLNAIILEKDGVEKLFSFLSSRKQFEARDDQIKHAQLMESRHTRLKKNFPPSKSGKYIINQADEFTQLMVTQWLSYEHKRLLEEMQKNISKFNPDVFKSIRLLGYVTYYKYYLGQREPKKLSDFGDLGHLFYIPYCELVVTERDLGNVLTQIKQNNNIMENTIVRNIELLNDWTL